MAERKATNKYYPPEWNPSKHGSINTFRGSHPLRERARKLDQGILIIRFELPFNVWCEGCNNHLGMGVRYNAEKSKIGMYYTTPVYQFRMKCHLCDNWFILKTDPGSLDYIVVEGARRQERRWSPSSTEQIDVDKSVKRKLSLDPMFALEHKFEDRQKAATAKSSLESLESFQSRWLDDYGSNRQLRARFRNDKKLFTKIAQEDGDLLRRSSLPITMPLEREDSRDQQLAKLLHFQAKSSFEESSKLKRQKIMGDRILPTSSKSSGTPIKFSPATICTLKVSSMRTRSGDAKAKNESHAAAVSNLANFRLVSNRKMESKSKTSTATSSSSIANTSSPAKNDSSLQISTPSPPPQKELNQTSKIIVAYSSEEDDED